MKSSGFFVGAIAMLSCSLSQMVYAQSGGEQSQGEPSGFRTGGSSQTVQEQVKDLADYMDKAKSLNRKDVKNLPTKSAVLARVEKAIVALKLQCGIKDAEIVGSEGVVDNGKSFEIDLYEVACRENTGYLIRTHERVNKNTGKPENPSAANSAANSCFAAEGTRKADEAKGIKSELYCQLPDNGGGDIKILAKNLLASAGVLCDVSKFRWFGIDETANAEIFEMACEGGTGYLLTVGLPGSKAAPSAMNCVEAGTKSIECKLTKVFVKPNLKTFKDYLAKTNLDCKIDDYNQINVIGRESIKQRYIVEFKCPQQPAGLVALIPLHENINPFESIDCAAAKKRGMACKLTVIN